MTNFTARQPVTTGQTLYNADIQYNSDISYLGVLFGTSYTARSPIYPGTVMPVLETGYWDDTKLWNDSLLWSDTAIYGTSYTGRIIPT